VGNGVKEKESYSIKESKKQSIFKITVARTESTDLIFICLSMILELWERQPLLS
jgi:hypothetical protein